MGLALGLGSSVAQPLSLGPGVGTPPLGPRPYPGADWQCVLHVLLWVATPTFHGALTWNLLMWSFVEPMVVPVLVVWCAVCQFPYLGILPKLGVVHAVPYWYVWAV